MRRKVAVEGSFLRKRGKAVSGAEGKSVFGCNVWEHAYYLRCQNCRADYLKAFLNAVNWAEVGRHYAAAKQ
jgi:superoxide dismutase, Fe-Mn family